MDKPDEKGLTGLMWAAGYGQLNSARLLLKAGANKNYRGPEGQTPLHLAAAYGHHDLVKLLLNHGADPNVYEEVSHVFFYRVKYKDSCMRYHILYSAKIHFQTINFQEGNTPLIYGAQGDHPHVCYELLCKGADITHRNANNTSAYQAAISKNSSSGTPIQKNSPSRI